MTIDTKHVSDFRKLRFASLSEMLADAQRICEADRAGKLRRSGNWTAGQNFAHVAAFMNYPYDGYPPELAKGPPWIFKVMAKMMKKKFLTQPLPRGFRIPKIKNGTVGQDEVSTDQGFARLKAAAERLAKAPPAMPNPVFGPLTHEEWMQLHQRHGELHFGYLHPQ